MSSATTQSAIAIESTSHACFLNRRQPTCIVGESTKCKSARHKCILCGFFFSFLSSSFSILFESDMRIVSLLFCCFKLLVRKEFQSHSFACGGGCEVGSKEGVEQCECGADREIEFENNFHSAKKSKKKKKRITTAQRPRVNSCVRNCSAVMFGPKWILYF